MSKDNTSLTQSNSEDSVDPSSGGLSRRGLLFGLGGVALGGILTSLDGASGDERTANLGRQPTISSDGSKPGQVGTACCWAEEAKLTASDASTEDGFGTGLALTADQILVGAPGAGTTSSGTVYVFERSDGNWQVRQTLTGISSQGDEEFGTSVAVAADGTLAVVGAPSGNSRTSTAYVFEREGDTWRRRSRFTEEEESSGSYGASVATDSAGDTVLVGDPGAGDGAVSVRRDSADGWPRTTRFSATVDQGSVDDFGTAVTVDADGSTAVVGAPGSDLPGLGSGGAFAFERGADGWQQVANLTDVDGDSASYGTDVAVDDSGEAGFVGAPVPFPDTPNAAGYVTVLGDGDGWSRRARLQTPTGDDMETLGSAVDVDSTGDVAVVGDAGDDVGRNDNQGSFSVFTRLSSRWCYVTTVTAADGGISDGLGTTVAADSDGTTVAAGAPGAVVDGASAGAVYLFTSSKPVGPSDGIVVDDFERDSLDEYVALAGSADDWAIQDDTVASGDSALQYRGGSSPTEIASLSGLPTYPAVGDVFRLDFRPLGDWEFRTSFNFGQQPDAGFHDRYELELDPGDSMVRLQYDDPSEIGDRNLGVANVEFDRETFYTVEVDWLATGDRIDVTLFDGRPSAGGSVVARLAGETPEGAPTDGGIGVFANGEGDRWVYDAIRIIE